MVRIALGYVWCPQKISMTEKEIELAMKGLFRGASKVRARKNAKNLSSNVNRNLSARIDLEIWQEEDFLKAA